MKYNEKNIKRIVKAIEVHPFHTFWNIHLECKFDEMKHCEIWFETLDGDKMCFVICDGDINAIAKGKWRGACSMSSASDGIIMWIGCKLNEMYELFMNEE